MKYVMIHAPTNETIIRIHQIQKVSPKNAGKPPRPHIAKAVHFTPNTSEIAEQIASMIPSEISGFLVGSKEPNSAGSVMPTMAIKEPDKEIDFKFLFLLRRYTPKAAPPTAIFP